MEYEKKHANIGHKHAEGKKCMICKNMNLQEQDPMKAKREKVNPAILANTRSFGTKGIRYDQSHLLNYKGVAQPNAPTRHHDWKNSIYNSYYKAVEENKYAHP